MPTDDGHCDRQDRTCDRWHPSCRCCERREMRSRNREARAESTIGTATSVGGSHDGGDGRRTLPARTLADIWERFPCRAPSWSRREDRAQALAEVGAPTCVRSVALQDDTERLIKVGKFSLPDGKR